MDVAVIDAGELNLYRKLHDFTALIEKAACLDEIAAARFASRSRYGGAHAEWPL